MNIQEHTHPDKLEKYSFYWSEVRLLIASIALFLGGIPPVFYFIRINALYCPLNLGLQLAWVISGVASAYMLYRWNQNGRKLFGGSDSKVTAAFFISVISGLNLGVVGIFGTNIGMNITMNYFVFCVVGLAYIASAFYLHKEWKSKGGKIF